MRHKATRNSETVSYEDPCFSFNSFSIFTHKDSRKYIELKEWKPRVEQYCYIERIHEATIIIVRRKLRVVSEKMHKKGLAAVVTGEGPGLERTTLVAAYYFFCNQLVERTSKKLTETRIYKLLWYMELQFR